MLPFLYLTILFLLITAAYAGWRGAPWVPTRSKDLHQALEVVAEATHRYAIDLGCGTGSLLFVLAQKYPDMKLHGYDISLAPLFFGWIRKSLSPKHYKNVHLHWKNLYRVNVSLADLIFVFMMPEPHTRIAKTVLHRAKPDTLILFEAWPPDGFAPERTIKEPGCLPLHMYRGGAFSQVS
jgi:SAM-dependent methyltransferase